MHLQTARFRPPSRSGGERGVARPEVLQALLGTCDRVVQEVDSVEYGLTDIQARACVCMYVCMYVCF